MICVSSKILSARSVNRPSAVDLVKVAVPSGFKFIGLLVRHLAAFVFDNEGTRLNRRCREKAQTSVGTADAESSFAGHITHVRRFAPGNHLGARPRITVAATARQPSGMPGPVRAIL
jgi:hypothetical protein